MYMRVVRSRFADPSKIDEAIGQVASDVAAAYSRQPGYQSVTGGVDRTSGRAIIVSTWDTEDHARWSPPDVLGDIVSKLQALNVQTDPPEIYEVTTT
jgi:heme-degrading monooxygenase HmoA